MTLLLCGNQIKQVGVEIYKTLRHSIGTHIYINIEHNVFIYVQYLLVCCRFSVFHFELFQCNQTKIIKSFFLFDFYVSILCLLSELKPISLTMRHESQPAINKLWFLRNFLQFLVNLISDVNLATINSWNLLVCTISLIFFSYVSAQTK